MRGGRMPSAPTGLPVILESNQPDKTLIAEQSFIAAFKMLDGHSEHD
jgi:hypothetical protein